MAMAWYEDSAQRCHHHVTAEDLLQGQDHGGDLGNDLEAGDLPFDVHDLPPEIRLKIDDIIRNNEDLEAQMDAIDALLFGAQPVRRPSDPDAESGIDTDYSGSITSSEYVAMTSSSSPYLPRDPSAAALQSSVESTSGLSQLDDVDDFIARMTVLPPPAEFDGGPEVSNFDHAFLPPADLFPGCSLLPPLPEIDEEDPQHAWMFQLPPPLPDDFRADTLPVVLPPPVFGGQSNPLFQTESQTQQRITTPSQKVSTNYPPIAPKPPKTPTAEPDVRPNFPISPYPQSPTYPFEATASTSSTSAAPLPAARTSTSATSLNGTERSKASASTITACITSTTSSVTPASTTTVSCPPVAPKPAGRPVNDISSVAASPATSAASEGTSATSTMAPSSSCPALKEEPSVVATVIAADSPKLPRRRFSGNTDTLQPENNKRSSKLKTFFKFGRMSGFDHDPDKPSKTKKHSVGLTSPTSPLVPTSPAATPTVVSNGSVAGGLTATLPRPNGKQTAPTWSKIAQEEAATARQKTKKPKKQKNEKLAKQETKAAVKEPKETKHKLPLLATHLGISATLPRLPSNAPQRPTIVSVDDRRLTVQDQAPQVHRRLSDECIKPVTFTTAVDDDDDDEQNGKVDEEDGGSETCGSSSDDDEGPVLRRGPKSRQPFRDDNGRLMFANSDGTLTKAHSMMCLTNIGRSADADAATSKHIGKKSKTVDEPSLSRSSHFPAGGLVGTAAAGNGGATEKSASKPSPTASSVSGGTLKGRYKKNLAGLPVPAADRSPRVQQQQQKQQQVQRPAAPVRTTPVMTCSAAKMQNGGGSDAGGGDSMDQEIELLRRCDYLSPAFGSTSSGARPSPAAMTDKLLRRSLAADDLPPPAVPFLLPADGGELSVDVRAEPGGSAANTSTSSFGSFGTFRGNMKPIRWSEDSPCPAASSGLAASRISAVGGSRSASDGGGTKSGDSGRLSLPAYMVVQTPTSALPPVTVQARNGSNSSPKMTSAVGNERNTANGDGAKVKPQTQPRKVTAVPNNVNVVPPTSSTSTAVPALTTLTTASRTTAPLTLPRPSLINSPATPDTRSSAAATGVIKPTTTSTASVSATYGPTGTSFSEATTANFSVAAAARVQSNRISTCSAVIDDVFIPEPAPDYATDDHQLPEPLLDDLLLPAPEGYAFDLPPPVFEFGDDVTLPNEINWQDDLPEVELHNDELIASKAYVTTADPCLEAEDDIDLLTSDLQLHVNTSLNGGAVPLLTSEDLAVARDTVETLSLAVRQFVTDSKNFVSAAAAVDVIEFGTCVQAAMHTLAGIVTCCRRLLVVRSPGDGGVSGVVSGVLDTARTFRTTIEAGRLTGLCTTDAEIEEAKNDVLEQAGELATSLSRLVQAVRILAQQQ